MYLSQLRLNSRNRAVLRDLASPNDMHKTLWRAFPEQDAGGPGRILFRVEPADPDSPHPPTILVQSEKHPDWSALPREYLESHSITSLEFTAEPTGNGDGVLLRRDDRFRFRLMANPTKKLDGRRHGLYREDEQRDWLNRKASDNGFKVVPHSLLVVPQGTIRSNVKDERRRSWFGVRFEGRLQVADPEAFIAALLKGIGPAKAFGFGLLSIAPA